MLFRKFLLPEIKAFGRAHVFDKSRGSQDLECVLCTAYKNFVHSIKIVKNINIIYQMNEIIHIKTSGLR